MFEKQRQSVGQGALAIQAQGNVTVGISYEVARQIALDVYQANFPLLVKEAAGLARARAEELTDKFLKQLQEENPSGFMQAIQPDFQNALLNAQREHACAGNPELADLLVDLLVDRTKQGTRDLLRLVIDEALKTAPKLTDQQLAVLGAAFLLGHVRSTAGHWKGVIEWTQAHLKPIIEQAIITPSTLPHLQFTGCATFNGAHGSDIATGLFGEYAGFFQTGFTDAVFQEQALSLKAAKYIKPLPTMPDLKWVAISSAAVIDALKEEGEFSGDDANKLKYLLSTHQKTVEQFREQVVAEMPFMQRAFDLWQKDKLGEVSLTSVGMAIGHAFVKKTIKSEFVSLSIWIK